MKAFIPWLSVFFLASAAPSVHAATDAYLIWATTHWGAATVGSTVLKSSHWGENADPDQDGIVNLIEYTTKTDPTRHNPPSDCWQFSISPAGAPEYRFPQITAWVRTDDPDLRVIAQTSLDLSYWTPSTLIDFSLPQPVNPAVWEQEIGTNAQGQRHIRYLDRQSMAQRSQAFMRLLVVRRSAVATTPGIEPFSFTSQPGVATGSTARSSAIVLGGFAGNVTLTIPAGVTLFVNGVAKTGSTATVKAGDTLWMQATAPGTVGIPRNYTLSIGGQSATWTFTTTAAIAAVPDHPGTDSGYTPVETGVSDTGAAQISIPIVVSPGTAGMQPNPILTYSSLSGNSPFGLGVNFSEYSVISRVGATIAQDGFKGGVNFDANDRFALNGQRLIAINGADGADGTEYRLEFDPSTRVRSYGISGSGPERWVVETNSGIKMEYGNDAESVLRPNIDSKGFVINEKYNGVGARSGVAGLLANPSYPDYPITSFAVNSLQGQMQGLHFGQRLRGFLVPKISGNYNFRVENYYHARMEMNPAGASLAGMIVLAPESPSHTIPQGYDLIAGTKYRFQILHYGYNNNNPRYVQVLWKGPGIAQGANGEFTEIISSEYLEADTESSAGSEALAWGISKKSDSLDNSIRYEYASSALAEGNLLLSKIKYTENASKGLVANNEISLLYEGRPDVRVGYVPNSLRGQIKQSKRLKTIESFGWDGTSSKLVRRYDMMWRESQLSGQSLLDAIEESTGSGISRVTTLRWHDKVVSTFTASQADFPAATTGWDVGSTQTGDFDGDGKADIFCTKNGKLNVVLCPGSSNSTAVTTNPALGLNTAAMWLLDVNNDGLTDLATRLSSDPTIIKVYLSNGQGGFNSMQSRFGVDWSLGKVMVGDVDGDGRTDLISGFETSNLKTLFSNGDGTFSLVASETSWNYTSGVILPGDFNADGKTDFISVSSGDSSWVLNILSSNGDGTFYPRKIAYPSSKYGPLTANSIIGDFNGDSVSDVALVSGTTVTVFLICGDQIMKTVSSNLGTSALYVNSNYGANFNADNLTDIFAWANNVTTIVRLISKGDGTFLANQLTNPSPAYCSQVWTWLGDFDGDGKTEPLSATSKFTSFNQTEQTEDLLKSVTTGHGGVTEFTYKPLTDSTVYTKGSGAPAGCYDIQAAINVVSSVNSRNGIDGDAFTGVDGSTPNWNTVNYRYEGAWTCLNGRGFQGFKAVETTNVTAGIITRTEYESSTPLLGGRVKHTEQRLVTAPVGGSVLISDSDTTWNITTTTNAGHPNTYFVTEASSISTAYEVNRPAGSALVKTATRNGFSYDGYGNLLTSTTTTSGTETFNETVTNTYADAPTPTQWFLGRLETSTVTKTGPNPTGSGAISLTRSSSFAYNPTTGLLTQEVIEPSGGILRQQKDYTHDGFGNILTSTISTSGAASRTTTTTYTPDGRFVATTTNALNHTESKTYDPLLGNVLTQTGPNNLTTTWNYDSIGRPIQENRPDGTVTRSFYRRVTGSTVGASPRAVHYVRVQSSGGAPKTVWYDLLDREIRADGIAFDGRTVSSHKVFNNRGEVTHASQPYFAGDTPLYSQMFYDAVGRETQQTDPGNRVTKTTYDGLTTTVERNYNPTALTDFQKAVTVVNALGWTVQSSQYLGTAAKTITRKYDPYGNLRFVTDPANNTTELRYDVRGNKTYMSEPNSGTSTFPTTALANSRRRRTTPRRR